MSHHAQVIDWAPEVEGPTDEDLFKGIHERSREAFETLFSRYKDRVLRYVYFKFFPHDIQQAEDVVQETFFILWERADPPLHTAKFSSWIFLLARCQAYTAFRRKKVRGDLRTVLHESHGWFSELAFDDLDLADRRERQEECDVALETLQRLPETFRRVLQMQFLEGLSESDMALQLGVPEGTVKSRKNKAKQNMAENMGSYMQTGIRGSQKVLTLEN